MANSPPLGIKLLSVLWAAIGAGGAFYGIFLLLVGRGTQTALLVLVGAICLSAGYAIIAYGLWTVRSWAWPAGMVLAVLTVGTVFLQDQIDLAGVIVPVLILVYLATKRNVYAREVGAA